MSKNIVLEESAGYNQNVIEYIHRASATGLYEIRGMGAKRHLPSFDDLVFLAGSASRYPLEGYREKCTTKTVLGTRFAKKPIELATPITIAGMSFGELCRFGLAMTWPLLLVALAALGVFIAILQRH